MIVRPETDVITQASRENWIFNHRILVGLDRWNENLSLRDLAGGPVRASIEDGTITSTGRAFISRGELFQLGSRAHVSGEDALRLLWHSTAWGVGTRFRLCKKRMDSVVQDPECAEKLAEVALISRTDCAAAYEAICPSGSGNLIDYLGPSFATKFLYFAGGGDEGHPCLILDEVVSAALHARNRNLPRSYGKWTTGAYVSYCTLLREWAGQRSQELDRTVGADEYERLLFSLT
jgi:hypothetical protein